MWLNIILIAISVLLTTSILLQQRGAGGSGVFGGSDASYYARRGAEKILLIASITLSALFIGGAFLRLLL